MSNRAPLLALKKIRKVFGNTIALNDMDFTLYPGETLGLVGANGAGKSTLMKVITGVYPPTSGEIQFAGETIDSKHYLANDAKHRGISCAYQELSLCSNLSAYENFSIGLDHTIVGRAGWRKKAAALSQEKLNEVFPDNGIDIKKPISALKLAQRQMVEITRAISAEGLRILILDEPTSSLTADRINQLHAYMRRLCGQGVAIIYISHKLDEIDRICDRITVMQAGKNVLTADIKDVTSQMLVETMGGQAEDAQIAHKDCAAEPVVLKIENLNTDTLHKINLEIHRGEIVGISGLAGSGQKDLLLEIFAAQNRRRSGVAMTTKASFVSGDRNTEGVFPMWDIANNTLVSSYEQVSKMGVLQKARVRELAQYWYDKLKFKANGIDDDITSLSGGNQQKALIARGICADTGIIILNDSTCGVDIGTKQEIYRLLEEARNEGKTVIWHSTEDQEMERCDRVLVMHEGRIARELRGGEISVKNIVAASFASAAPEREGGKEQKQKSAGRESALLKGALENRAALPTAVMLLILLTNVLMNKRIATYSGLNMLYSSAIPLVLISLSQMFLVLTGGIDMGNGIAVGLTNVLFAFVVSESPAMGTLGLALFVIAYGALGALIYAKRMPAIVVTLGASYIWRGVGLILAPHPGGSEVGLAKLVFEWKCPLIPTPLVLAALFAFVCWWIVKRSKYGMIICGTGNNPNAIARAGWSKMAAIVSAYTIAGALLVIAGLSMNSISKGGDINSTASYQMMSIATIILGGCEFTGGIVSPVGVVTAALAISSISTLLTMLGIDSNLQSAVTGLILIAALALKLLLALKRERRD